MHLMEIGSLAVSVTVAQTQEGAAAPGGGGPVVPGAPGTGTAPPPPGGLPSPTGGGGLSLLAPLMIVMVVFILMTTMAGRKEKKRRAALLSSVKRGDRVQTVGGEIGTIVDLTETEMTLRVDDVTNTRIRFTRSALQQVLKEGKEADGKAKAEPTPAH